MSGVQDMLRRHRLVEEPCFAAEGLSGTAAAASLRKPGSFVERAPSGRLFGAISTLSDMSAKAAQALAEGSLAIELSGEEAAARIGHALAHMDGPAERATRTPELTTPRRRAAR